MKQLIDNLGSLLDNFENLRDGSLFLQSEGEEWYEADKYYIEELRSWADSVESLLNLAGRREEAQRWREARRSPITLLNVYNHAERLQIFLRQIKLEIEQEYNYAPDLAQVARTPLLSHRDVADAYRMSELYVILHCYENSVRRFVEEVLTDTYGENWWEQVASRQMQELVKSRKETEQKRRWLSPRGQASPLYYVEWGDLVKLIRKEQQLFLPDIGSLRFVENRFEELESLRNIVAHNGVLPSDDDFQRVIISFRDWCRQLENRSNPE